MAFVSANRTVPDSFVRLTAATAAAAAIATVVAGVVSPVDTDPLTSSQFWLLAILTFAMELLPIRLPRGTTADVVTVSSAFALAVLFLFGTLPAMVVLFVASLAGDTIGRLGTAKSIFNASQYALCGAAAGVAFHLAGGEAPLSLTLADLPPMVVAAAVFFLANHLMAGVGVALLSQARVAHFLLADLGLLTWTTGFQLALAPLLVGAPGPLVVLGAVPVLAIYLGGRQAAQATHDANHDPLTGLANRGLFIDRLNETLMQRRGVHRTWLALLDLDDFKSINDTLGHACGDTLLRHVATRMRTALREGDVLGRLGGDEFAVILADCDRDGAVTSATRIIEHLGDPVAVGDLSLRVSASVGLASCDGPGMDAEMVLQHADVALYEAKEQRGTVTVFSTARKGAVGPALDRIALGSELAHALDTDQLYVQYQPKVAASDELAPAMEALVRWRHPRLGLVDPEAFVAIAEETGMIKRLTMRVMDHALERCADWRARGVDLRMCVNVSAKSLVDESLPGVIEDVLRRHNLPGPALQLEITETAALANVPRSKAVLDAVRALGVTLAIDDFGTGFSSLTQLQALDLEEVKIDRSFVMAMEDDPQAAVIVRSVVNLGHSLGLRVCAEGVETASALRRLRELGCDYVQGYLFGQPASDAAPLRPLTSVVGPVPADAPRRRSGPAAVPAPASDQPDASARVA